VSAALQTTLTALAANDIVLQTASNDFGDIQIVSGNNVSITDVNAIDFDGGVSTISGNLIVSAGGAITQADEITVAGTSNISTAGAVITLTDADNNFTGAVSLANTGAFAIQVTDVNSIDLGTVTTANNLTVIAGGTGDITDSGTIVASGTATFTASADDVILNSASSNYGTVIFGATTNNAVWLDVDAVVLGASDVDGTLTVTAGGDITDCNNLTVAGVANINAGSNDITLNNTTVFSSAAYLYR